MNTLAEKIHKETLRLPADLAHQVYDFICFIEKRHGIQPLSEENSTNDWLDFFKHHTHTLSDSVPFKRDEIYADRLR
jgi:hypothetical protein